MAVPSPSRTIPQKKMLGGYVALPHLHGLAQRVLKHALDPGGERKVAGNVRVLVDGGDLADVLHDVVVLHALAVERLGRQPLLLGDEPEQDVLGANVGLTKLTRLVLCEN